MVMVLNTVGGRDAILVRLREPGAESDKLISALLGLDEKAWTRDFELAESLVPMRAIYTLSHNDDRSFYWCDVSDGLHNVQGWGRTPACAVAAGGVAYVLEAQEGWAGRRLPFPCDLPDSLH
jgi:hypothetical protein